MVAQLSELLKALSPKSLREKVGDVLLRFNPSNFHCLSLHFVFDVMVANADVLSRLLRDLSLVDFSDSDLIVSEDDRRCCDYWEFEADEQLI